VKLEADRLPAQRLRSLGAVRPSKSSMPLIRLGHKVVVGISSLDEKDVGYEGGNKYKKISGNHLLKGIFFTRDFSWFA